VFAKVYLDVAYVAMAMGVFETAPQTPPWSSSKKTGVCGAPL
jgi:hypothetical protein